MALWGAPAGARTSILTLRFDANFLAPNSTYLATDSVAFKAAVENDLNHLLSTYWYGSSYSTGWTYLWGLTDFTAANWIGSDIRIEIPRNQDDDKAIDAFNSWVVSTSRWNYPYSMLPGGTVGALVSSFIAEGIEIKYDCGDGTYGNLAACGDTCDNNQKMVYEVMRFIKVITKQTMTKAYDETARIGYCQIYIIPDPDNVEAWEAAHGLQYATGTSTLPELGPFYDPNAAGQLQPDGTYTGGAIDATGSTTTGTTGGGGGFSSAAVINQPISMLFAVLALVLAAFL
jgi:hypothetical protein